MTQTCETEKGREIGALVVWHIPLMATPEEEQRFRDVLSATERERADAFQLAGPRRRFVVARAAQRQILADLLSRRPQDLRFVLGPCGKPSLDPCLGEADIQFNMTHSNELALLAVRKGREVGVDVEWLGGALGDVDALARRFFAAEEHEALLQLPEPERRTGFFRLWTRKEAVSKAIGAGLTMPLDQTVVNLAPGETARLLRVGAGAPSDWVLQHLDPAPGYIGALASRGPICLQKARLWSPASPLCSS